MSNYYTDALRKDVAEEVKRVNKLKVTGWGASEKEWKETEIQALLNIQLILLDILDAVNKEF